MRVINRCDAGIWLFKLSLADRPFQTIVFAVTVFDINKHAEPIFEWNFLHCRIVSAKYCYVTHELRLHQNDRCKRFTEYSVAAGSSAIIRFDPFSIIRYIV